MLVYLNLLGFVACAYGRPQDQDLNLISHSLCNPGYLHQLIPHEKDCDKFYFCQFGLRSHEPLKCDLGTEFSVSYRACVPPALSNCKSAKTNTALSYGLPKDLLPEDVLPNGCPKDFNKHLLVPHDTKLNKFYFCKHGELEEINCSGSTIFNNEKQVCDWPENIKNSSAGINVLMSSKTAEGSGENKKSGSVSGFGGGGWSGGAGRGDGGGSVGDRGGDVNEGGQDGIDRGGVGDVGGRNGSHYSPGVHGEGGCSCGEGSDGNGEAAGDGGVESIGVGEDESDINEICQNECYVPHWSHGTDCDKFWRCESNKKVLGVCSDGLHFNLATQTCDLISKVNCERKYVQSTAQRNGFKLFLPWNEVDKIVKLFDSGEIRDLSWSKS